MSRVKLSLLWACCEHKEGECDMMAKLLPSGLPPYKTNKQKAMANTMLNPSDEWEKGNLNLIDCA